LEGGIRPPLRLIATQDAPASYPMVLCISGVTWSEASLTDDGMPIAPYPELEVTDGWYRLRAQVDAPLARAIQRGVIRIGRKIGVSGARVRFVVVWPCAWGIMHSSYHQNGKTLRRCWKRTTRRSSLYLAIRLTWPHGMQSLDFKRALVFRRCTA
jgi:BRCA2, oligonucleotide/oligosaccharide-binding, domain 1